MGLFSFFSKRKTQNKRKQGKTRRKRGGMTERESRATQILRNKGFAADILSRMRSTEANYDEALKIYMDYIGRKKGGNVSMNVSTAHGIAYFLHPRGFKGNVFNYNAIRNYYQNEGKNTFIEIKNNIKSEVKNNKGKPGDYDSVVAKFETDLKNSKEEDKLDGIRRIENNERETKIESTLTRYYKDSNLTRDDIFNSPGQMVNLSGEYMFKVEMNYRDTELFLYGSIDNGTTWYRGYFDGPNKINKWTKQ